MADSQFVYVTYIRTTPEKLWQALIDPEFTRRFWCETWQDCEWKPGSKLIDAVSTGWPAILSSLKSLLETGESLEATRRWPKGV
jgi:hypothetical protein